jgi:predicted outer membrane repeat protein
MFRTLLISLFITSTALATTWTVDDDGKADFDNIQAAVDAANDGDEIIVMPGTYTSTQDGHVVNMLGKAVTLRSSDPTVSDVVAATIIDGEGVRRGIVSINSSADTVVIEGFTITNGYSVEFDYDGNGDIDYWEDDGGGLLNRSSDITISNCRFIENIAKDYGGGICCRSGVNLISNCTFIFNTCKGSSTYGGGGGILMANGAESIISDCEFRGNTATNGGGIFFQHDDHEVSHCYFEDNFAYKNGGGIEFHGDNLTLTDTVFCANNPDSVYGKWLDGGGNCMTSSCEDSDDDGFPDKCTSSGGNVLYVPDEYPTIQSAINAAVDTDEIIISPGTYTGDSNTVINMMGKEIWIHSSDGPEVTIIDGEGSRRGIQCTAGETRSTIIEGLTVMGCYASSGSGIYCNFNSNPTILNCMIKNNIAEYLGSGIYVSPGCMPLLDNTVVCGNIPDQCYGPWQGGGNCIAYDCKDSDDDGFPDSCIDDGDNTLRIPEEYPTIQVAIESASDGDEILIGPGTYRSKNNIHYVINPMGKKLWIHSSDGPEVTIIDGESARTVLECTSNETNLTIIEGLTLTDGFSTYAGGGVYCNGSPLIKDCVIEGNSAEYGAGIYCRNTLGLEIINCQIKDNSASINGGGIYTRWGIVNLTNCVLENNNAGVGGGLYSDYLATTNVTNCLLFNNTANDSGGGFYNSYAYLTFYKTTISSNQSSGVAGGGSNYSYWDPFNGDVTFIRMYSCLFDGNEADSEGGGLYLKTGSSDDDSEIINCTFRNNSAYHGGGGIYCNDDINITNCVFESNTTQSTGNGGAGIYCDEFCQNATISNCTFIDNYSENGGGGLSAFGGGGWQSDRVILRDCVFENNRGSSGGALRFYNGLLEISDCIVTDNHSEYGGGFFIAELSSTSFIDNCTISNNQASEGGGIYFYQSTSWPLLLTDTTVCGNLPDQIYGNLTDNGGNIIRNECPIDCPDINGDGYVNVSDLLIIIDQWGVTDSPNNSPADLNFDGIVDVVDLLIVIDNWGACE